MPAPQADTLRLTNEPALHKFWMPLAWLLLNWSLGQVSPSMQALESCFSVCYSLVDLTDERPTGFYSYVLGVHLSGTGLKS